MSYISSIPHGQLMLPCSIDGYVSSDHIVRFKDAFVDRVIRSNPGMQKKVNPSKAVRVTRRDVFVNY
jgi:hypothetical protein